MFVEPDDIPKDNDEKKTKKKAPKKERGRDVDSDGNSYRKTMTNYHEMAKDKDEMTEKIFGKNSLGQTYDPTENTPVDKALDFDIWGDEEEEDDGPVTDDAGLAEGEYKDYAEYTDLTDVDRSLPYLIDSRDFDETCKYYEKKMLAYYTEDDVLCTEEEDVVDIDETVGWDCFKLLDIQNTAWVRNESIETDFEIYNVRASYAEAVHGITIDETLTPRERYLRQTGKDD